MYTITFDSESLEAKASLIFYFRLFLWKNMGRCCTHLHPLLHQMLLCVLKAKVPFLPWTLRLEMLCKHHPSHLENAI